MSADEVECWLCGEMVPQDPQWSLPSPAQHDCAWTLRCGHPTAANPSWYETRWWQASGRCANPRSDLADGLCFFHSTDPAAARRRQAIEDRRQRYRGMFITPVGMAEVAAMTDAERASLTLAASALTGADGPATTLCRRYTPADRRRSKAARIGIMRANGAKLAEVAEAFDGGGRQAISNFITRNNPIRVRLPEGGALDVPAAALPYLGAETWDEGKGMWVKTRNA